MNVWAHQSNLTPPLFIEVSVPKQESEQSCICILEVSIVSHSTKFVHWILQLCRQLGIFLFFIFSMTDDLCKIITLLDQVLPCISIL